MDEEKDKSIELLSKIVVDYDGILDKFSGGGGEVVGGAISQMFGVLNAFAVMATGLVLTYLLSVAILQTAHDGEPLGKRYSTLWMPIRTVGAFLLVIPFPGLGGFSVIQAMIFGLVGLSITGANMLYEKELAFFEDNGGSLMPLAITPEPPGELVRGVLEASLCNEVMASENAAYGKMSALTEIKPSEQTSSTGEMNGLSGSGPGHLNKETTRIGAVGEYGANWSGEYDKGIAYWGKDVMCGEVKVKCTDKDATSLGAAVCAAKGAGIIAMANYANNITKPMANDKQVPVGSLKALIDEYRKAWRGKIESARVVKFDDKAGPKDENGDPQGAWVFDKTGNDSERKAIDDFTESAKTDGWLTAGQWYWLLSAKSLEQQRHTNPPLTIKRFNIEEVPDGEKVLVPPLQTLNDYLDVVSQAEDPVAAQSNISQDSSDSRINALFSKAFTAGASNTTFSSIPLDSNDPIRSLASFGQGMIGTGTGALVTLGVIGLVGGVSTSNLVGKISGADGGFKYVWEVVILLVTVTAGPLIFIGGMLAYYLPAVPFIFWTLAILGWLIMFIESLVAAPLWAVAHAVPEGDGFAGRAALQGWQLMLNVVFRPILLTLGLLLSMFVMHAIAFFAVKGYEVTNMSIINSTTLTAMWGFIFSNLIMAILVIVLAHKSHEIIYDTADNVMKWIGFGVQPLGAVKNEQQISGMFKAAGSAGESMTAGAMRMSGGKGGRGKEEEDRGGGGGGQGNVTTGHQDTDGGTQSAAPRTGNFKT